MTARARGLLPAILAAALAWPACRRIQVSVGHAAGGGAGDASATASGGAGGKNSDASGGGDAGGGDAACPEPALGKLPAPGWTCGEGCLADPAVAVDAAMRFAGPADPAPENQPEIKYPLDGAMHPINLRPLTFQWRRGGAGDAQTLFRIHLAGGARTYDFYAPCVQPPSTPTPPGISECTYTPREAAWRTIAADNRGGELTATLSATDGRDGAPVATSAPVRLRFSPGPVLGGLYYWSAEILGIYRLPFGAAKPQPFIVPNSAASRFDCNGCHAVSRGGDVIAFAARQDGYLTVASADDPSRVSVRPPDPPVPDGHVPTLSPDGKLVLASYGNLSGSGLVVVRESATGKAVAQLNPTALGLPESKVFFPDWSPDGSEIVATVAIKEERPWSVNDGAIVVFPYNAGSFGKATVIVPRDPQLFHYYPSWSPDGQWIIFVSAPLDGRSSYNNVGSRLRLVSRAGGKIHELGRASQGSGQTSTWPRFAPFAQSCGKLLFFTFNTQLDYGYLLKNTSEPAPFQQIWMAAIDLDRLDSGDPSTAPVWLPFQQRRQKNLHSVWAERVPCLAGAPGNAACGEDATCTSGVCVPMND